MIRLPDPTLVLLIGPSASGKSTWAAEHFASDRVVSSDRMRALVGEGEHDLAASTTAFALLDQVVGVRMERRLTTVVDTLGLDGDRRRSWRELAERHGVPCVAVAFDTPAAECRRRTAARSVREAAPEPATSLRFGLQISSFETPGGPAALPDRIREVVSAAEHAGFSSIWVMDHFRQAPQLGRPWDSMLESTTALGYVAAATSRVSVGCLVHGVTYRNIAHLGKIVATLDVLTGGRAWCGIGAAWYEAEHRAYGWPFPPAAERFELLEDALQLFPLLWGPGTPSFEGRRVRVPEAMCYPRPLRGRIPILVGGSGERRTLRLAAQYADACNLFGDTERVRHKIG